MWAAPPYCLKKYFRGRGAAALKYFFPPKIFDPEITITGKILCSQRECTLEFTILLLVPPRRDRTTAQNFENFDMPIGKIACYGYFRVKDLRRKDLHHRTQMTALRLRKYLIIVDQTSLKYLRLIR